MRYLLIITLILKNLLSNAQPDSLLASALLNAELRLYYSVNDSERFNILFDKAELYKNAGNNEKALQELKRAGTYCKTVNESAHLRYQKLLNYFLAGQYNDAISIELFENEIRYLNKSAEYYSIRLLALNELQNWKLCKQELLRNCHDCDSMQKVFISALPITFDYRSPEKCSRWSSFIPGAGQIKAGYPLKGIASILIQGGLITFTGYNYYSAYYITGSVTGLLPFRKFYKGGIRLSGILAEEHNQNRSTALKEKYRKIILEHFTL